MIKNAKITGVGIDPDTYHNVEIIRGDPTLPMSPSSLKEFAKCASRWRAGYQSPDSNAKHTGKMLDTFILTPEAFGTKYAVLPSDAPRKPSSAQINAKKPSPETVEAIKWWTAFRAAHGDAEIIDLDNQADCLAASKSLKADEVISAYLDASDRQVCIEAQWHDETTGLIIPIRCLLDLVPRDGTEFEKTAGDYKTVSSASLGAFQRKVFDLGWHIQGAFDLDMLALATGQDRNTWVWIVQENYAPWQPGKRMMAQSFLEIGRTAYKRALKLYCQCLKTGKWFNYDDHDEAIQTWSLVEASPWMESDGLFQPKFDAANVAPAETDNSDITP